MRKLLISSLVVLITGISFFSLGSIFSVQAAVAGPDAAIFGAQSLPPEIRDTQEGIGASLEGVPNQDGNVVKTLDAIAAGLYLNVAGGKPQIDDNGNLTYSEGAIGNTTRYLAYMLQTPPATTETYIADLLDSANIAQPAYAQGLGFASLSPILEAWKTFRNIAYLFFVLIFLAIGFMIMFRQKIGGQTVVTAQQAIPRIVVTLLVVTFSYAIAGLAIDIMYLVMYLMIGIFGQSQDLVDMNFVELGYTMVSSGGVSVYQVVGEFAEATVKNQFGGLAGTIGSVTGFTIAVIVAISILISVFRLFLELLKTYISVIISITLSPVLLMMGAIPGRNVFGGWLKSLFGNLAAFPTVLLILIIFNQLTGGLTGTSGDANVTTGGFLPPYLLGTGTGELITFLIGFGMILIMPKLVEQAKTALGAGKGPFDIFGQAVADSLKAGWRGDELVPGLGFTKLSNYGISGKNLVQKQAVAGAGIAGAGLGALSRPRRPLWGAVKGATDLGGRAALAFDEKTLFQGAKERIKKEQEAKRSGGGGGSSH